MTITITIYCQRCLQRHDYLHKYLTVFTQVCFKTFHPCHYYLVAEHTLKHQNHTNVQYQFNFLVYLLKFRMRLALCLSEQIAIIHRETIKYSLSKVGAYDQVDRALDSRSKGLWLNSHCWSFVQVSDKLLIPRCHWPPNRNGCLVEQKNIEL